MTFDDWFWEIEKFSGRNERFYDALERYRNGDLSEVLIVDWLKAAYDTGREHEQKKYSDDGK